MSFKYLKCNKCDGIHEIGYVHLCPDQDPLTVNLEIQSQIDTSHLFSTDASNILYQQSTGFSEDVITHLEEKNSILQKNLEDSSDAYSILRTNLDSHKKNNVELFTKINVLVKKYMNKSTKVPSAFKNDKLLTDIYDLLINHIILDLDSLEKFNHDK